MPYGQEVSLVAHRSMAMTAADVARLPGGCSSCLRWERFVDHGQLDGDGSGVVAAADLTVAKQRWWVEASSSGSVGGVVVRAGGAAAGSAPLAGYATFVVPARGSGAALNVLGLHVDQGCRGVGLGRVLVLAVAREALRRPRLRAVEAMAARTPLSPCLVPLDFWLACGFLVVRDHPTTPRVRLDPRGLASWRSEVEGAVEQAWERLRGAVRPAPPPRPALRR